MNEEDFKKQLIEKLDEIRSILILSNKENLKKAKEDLLPTGSIKKKIFELCDGTKTASEIATEIEKESGYVNSYLSILRREGLISSFEKDGNLVHEQIF